jgi:hypothetical protein
MDFFFYGTLRDADVLCAVIGRSIDRLTVEPADLSGFRCVFRRGASYPVLRVAAGAMTPGDLVSGLTARELRRLVAYEGRDYRLARLAVRLRDGRVRPALVFMPKDSSLASRTPWSFAAWQKRDKGAFLAGLCQRSPGGATFADRSARRGERTFIHRAA